MENFNTLNPLTPDWFDITEPLTIDYPIRTISIENIGEQTGTVLGKNLLAGESLNFEAGQNGYYKANVWVLNPALDPVNPTTFRILINK